MKDSRANICGFFIKALMGDAECLLKLLNYKTKLVQFSKYVVQKMEYLDILHQLCHNIFIQFYFFGRWIITQQKSMYRPTSLPSPSHTQISNLLNFHKCRQKSIFLKQNKKVKEIIFITKKPQHTQELHQKNKKNENPLKPWISKLNVHFLSHCTGTKHKSTVDT